MCVILLIMYLRHISILSFSDLPCEPYYMVTISCACVDECTYIYALIFVVSNTAPMSYFFQNPLYHMQGFNI